MIFVWGWNLDCTAKIDYHFLRQFSYLRYLRPISRPIQSGINCMDTVCTVKKNLFTVPRLNRYVGLDILLIFAVKVQFSDPLFCSQTKPFCMQIVKKQKNSKKFLTTLPSPTQCQVQKYFFQTFLKFL